MSNKSSINKDQFVKNWNIYFPTLIQSGGILAKKDYIPGKSDNEICYKISVNLQLIEGTSISDSDVKKLKCKAQENAIYSSYAELRGLKYNPAPDYKRTIPFKKTTKNPKNNKNKKGGTRKRK